MREDDPPEDWSAAQKNDRDFMLERVLKNGLHLEHASETLRADREIVSEAVKQNGLSIMYEKIEVWIFTPSF